MSVSSSTSTSSGDSASLVVNGLISGIDTPQVIQALLSSYQAPITNLQNEQSTLNSQAADYKTLNGDMQSVLNAAQALNTSSSWNLMTASSSNSAVVTATASPGAQSGTLGFTVGALANANVLVSSGGVSSESASVSSSPSVLVATGGAAVGFAGLAGGGGLALGSHTIKVTQASSAASATATSPISGSTEITVGVNDTVDLSVNGTAYSLTLAPGSADSPAELVSAFNSAAESAGAGVTASLNRTGELVVSTDQQGSAATLSVTGGDGLSSLGLVSSSSTTGTDAVVTVDGSSTTLDSLSAGQVVSLAAPTGSISATIASSADAAGSLVGLGTVSSALVSTGNGSLSDVVQNINNAGLGATASVVEDSSGEYRLQVSANSTGLSGEVSLDPSSFSSGALGSLSTAIAATDASVTVGGVSGYTLTSSTNSFSDLMAGTIVNVVATGDASVTVGADASGEASQVATLVSAANQALSDINSLAGYNASTKTAGPLLGSAVVQNLKNSLESIFASASGTSGLGNVSNVGITLNSNASLSFDQSKFESAFAADPTAVANLFVQGGSFTANSSTNDGDASLVFAGTNSLAGSYDLTVDSSATQASASGSVLSSGTVSAPETLTVTSGTESASYAVADGESLDSIANGLNSAFAANGLEISALVVDDGTQLQLQSNAYGSAASFTVASSAPGAGTTGLGGSTAGDAVAYAGTDIAGSINGTPATGNGQVLAAPADDPVLGGLSLQVTTAGISSATNLGTFTYRPGLAQQLATLSTAATVSGTGSLTNTITGLTSEATGLDSQISNYQSIESSQQTLLQQEFATMESTLGTLKNESSSLTSAISGLSTL